MRFPLIVVVVVGLGLVVLCRVPTAGAYDYTLWLSNSNLVVQGGRALREGDVARAIRLTRQALAVNLTPNDKFKAFNNLCVAHTELREFDVALDYCEQALVFRNDWRALNNRANAKFGLGDIDGAIADYQTALELRPNAKVLADNLDLARERRKRVTFPPDTGDSGL